MSRALDTMFLRITAPLPKLYCRLGEWLNSDRDCYFPPHLRRAA